MRILHVIASADPSGGGPIEGARRLGQMFERMGHRSELLTLDTPDMPWVDAFPLPVHAMGRRPPRGRGPVARLRRWAARSPKALVWLRANRTLYDLVIVEGLWNYSTRIARQALVGGDTPYVVFTHGMLDPWFRDTYPMKHRAKQLLWRFNEGPLLRGAAAVLFTCEQERVLARQSFSPWGMREAVVGFGTVSPPSSPHARTALAAAIPALGERPFLLFLSRIHRKKGCDLLIDAFARVAGALPGVDLVIAGPGEAGIIETLQRRAQDSGIAERIHWPGMIQGDAKWQAFRACEAFILPSHQENFGVVVAEAMACGRPVLISNQVNIHPEISASRAGIVAFDTVEGTVTLIETLFAASPAERDAMGVRGKALFRDRFDMASVATRLATLFQAIHEGFLPERRWNR